MEQILVKIVKGVYGFDTGKTVVGKSAKDAPFLLDEDKARRLFDLGVAEPVCDAHTRTAMCMQLRRMRKPMKEWTKSPQRTWRN